MNNAMQQGSAHAIVRLGFLIAVAIVGCAKSASTNTPIPPRIVTVAAAADLKFALDEVIAEFKKEHAEIDVQTTYGSSGNFFGQLSNRAPFDIYFSADVEHPRKLIEAGHADQASEFQYAIGQIVLWAPKTSALDLEGQGMQSLLDPSVKKIAIANPEHAPYGRAAEAAMKKLGVYDQIRDKLVLGENISQTAQFIETGAADVGIIALSLALAPAMSDKGKHWSVPLDAYPTLEQGGVVLNWAKDPAAAKELRDFVMGETGRTILKRYGFLLPGE